MNLTNTSNAAHSPTVRVARIVALVSVFVIAIIVLNFIPSIGIYVLALPVYYHVLLFVSIGVWTWASNIHVLTSFGIDCNSLLGLHSNVDQGLPVASPVSGFLQLHARDFLVTYQMAFFFSTIVFTSIIIYEFWVKRFSGAIIVPSVTYSLLLLILMLPGGSQNKFFWSERRRFLQYVLGWNVTNPVRALLRCFSPMLYKAVPFSDVILADILTSFSRILGDLHTTFSDLVWVPGALSTGIVQSISPFITPMLVATPFLIRLRQCTSEYLMTKDPVAKRRHVLNGIKYATSFPVIITSTTVTNIQRKVLTHVVQDPLQLEQLGLQAQSAMRWWVMLSILHTVYSLYWDIVYDWNLGHVSGNYIHQFMSGGMGRGARNSKQGLRYPFLREHLHFPSPLVYYLAMLLDAGCRFAWFFKVVPVYRILKMELATDKDLSVGHVHRPTEEFIALDLTLKLLEVFRRWVWVFFRIENAWVESRHPRRISHNAGHASVFPTSPPIKMPGITRHHAHQESEL
jgi:hypothetical protein